MLGNWLAKQSIPFKFTLGFIAPIACLIIAITTAYLGFKEISANQRALYEVDMPAAIMLANLSDNIQRLRLAGQILIMSQEPTVKDKQIAEIFAVRQENNRIFTSLQNFFKKDQSVLASISHMQSELEPTYQIADQELKSAADNNLTDEDKSDMMREQRHRLANLSSVADKIAALPHRLALNRMLATQEQVANQLFLFISALFATIFVTVLQLIFLNRDLIGPLRDLTAAARLIEQGNLQIGTFASDRGDELGVLQRAFSSMSNALNKRSEDLQKAMDALHESNQELQHFAYVAAHDLQEPLRTVVSYLGLLEKRLDKNIDDKSKKYITNAISGSERMRSLIRGLLDVARVTTKASALAPVAVGDIIKQIQDDLRVYLLEKKATIVVGEMPTVNADQTQLNQVFQNLIQNAIKFQADRAPVVVITCEKIKDGRSQASTGSNTNFDTTSFYEFRVKDNGIGIDMEYAERIFALFQRLHTTTEYAGTGIGLSICKKIVERHGGKIRVESVKDEGSTFIFTIPC